MKWKKSFLLVLLVFMLPLSAFAGVQYNLTGIDYPIVVNGTPMEFSDAVPMNFEGRTMLPLRAVAEALGVPIEWDEANQQVNIETIDTEKLKESCVMVYSAHDGYKDGQYVTFSIYTSGIVIDYGKILTAFHVVDGYTDFKVIYNDSKEEYACALEDTATSKDAATLTTPEKNVKPVKIGDSDEVKVGDKVHVISCPDGEKNVVTEGKIAKFKSFSGGWLMPIIYGFESDAPTKGGSSGGACFNAKGELIGIVQGGKDDNTTTIIPINQIRQALAE